MGCCESTEENLVIYNIEPLPRDCNWNIWLTWKQKLLSTVYSESLKIESPEILGSILKKVIGPYGLDIIAENFIFRNSSDEKNFDTLLSKLDSFFHLQRFPRYQKTESIKEYVDRLKTIAKSFGSIDADTAVKENIIYDLNQNHFLEIVTEIICIRNSFRLKQLNTNELIFLVNAYENQSSRIKREDFLQKLENNKTFLFQRHNLDCCGNYHLSHGNCPARGQRCYKCDGSNHFARICNKLYIVDCIKCGINHAENQCPAFGMQCSRCDGLYHFHWKCLQRMITFCENCGETHVDNMTKCLAFGKKCSKCGMLGHLQTKCRSKRRL